MVRDKTITERVIHCAYKVSNELGSGFLESVYENALCIELSKEGLVHQQQAPIDVMYCQQRVGHFVADLIVENKVLVELKSVSGFNHQHSAQVINYLRATGLQVGLLINFGTSKMGIKRLVWQYDETEII